MSWCKRNQLSAVGAAHFELQANPGNTLRFSARCGQITSKVVREQNPSFSILITRIVLKVADLFECRHIHVVLLKKLRNVVACEHLTLNLSLDELGVSVAFVVVLVLDRDEI